MTHSLGPALTYTRIRLFFVGLEFVRFNKANGSYQRLQQSIHQRQADLLGVIIKQFVGNQNDKSETT
ncbi:hypothetical protein EF405_18785 [Cyclobacteriaceae bacterium YHN15]|nr:hypothetical protein EF405_18785 [Cyclobacteriaceae bacterium YHN15]